MVVSQNSVVVFNGTVHRILPWYHNIMGVLVTLRVWPETGLCRNRATSICLCCFWYQLSELSAVVCRVDGSNARCSFSRTVPAAMLCCVWCSAVNTIEFLNCWNRMPEQTRRGARSGSFLAGVPSESFTRSVFRFFRTVLPQSGIRSLCCD